MTIAIALTDEVNKLIMVDTAVSTIINGKFYRTDIVENKCFTKNNFLIFCSGNMFLADKMHDFICKIEEVDLLKISNYARSIYNEFKIVYPYKENINLWLWVIDKENFYKLENEDDFAIVDMNNKERNLNLIFCGHFQDEKGKIIYDDQEVSNTVAACINQNILYKKDLIECFLDIIKKYNCAAVGGTARFFTFDNKNNKFIHLKDVNVDKEYIYSQDELKQISNLDNAGNVVMKGVLNISDKIKVDADGNMTLYGGAIKWATSDPKILDAQSTADSANIKALNAQSMASDAKVIATSASGNISKLADGTYTGGTFINGTTISSPNIEGGIIAGGEFCDLYKKAKLVLNPTNSSSKNADLNLYSGNNVALRVYDNIAGSIDLSSYNNLLLRTGQFGTYAFGKWDFSNAEISGIDTIAKFA